MFQRVREKKLLNDKKTDIERLKPMESVSVDICYFEAVPYLVLVDEYSRYKAGWRIKDSSTKSVVNQLEQFFSVVGIPIILRSDGGPAFRNSFRKWCNSMGIIHSVSSPYHPQANGAAECGVREFKMLLKTTKAKGLKLRWLLLKLNNMQRQQ